MSSTKEGLGKGRRTGALTSALASAALLVSACGSSGVGTTAGTPAGAADAAYAGSLQLLNEKTVGPAFTAKTGIPYQGRGGGSFGLSEEIRAGEISPNVFESVGAAPMRLLAPKLASWYVQFASSPIVVAFNPHTSVAPQLEAIAEGKEPLADLFSVAAQPGFHLGRTNPNTDPQGQAFYEMVEIAQKALHLPAGTATNVLGTIDDPSEVFAETTLDARLQAGQLDAASAFLSQAVQLHLPYITLPPSMNFGDPADASSYASAGLTLSDGAVVRGTPLVVDITALGRSDTAAADAFVSYVLSPAGQASFKKAGYKLLTPTAFGNTATIPAQVRHELGGS